MPRVARPFWSLVHRGLPDGCWPWLGGRNSDGYGIYRRQKAHRVAYEVAQGPIPPGLAVCHRCDRPRGVFGQRVHPASIRAGERHWRAKLSADDVRSLRAGYAAGELQRVLAEKFHINAATVSRIVRREWRQEVA